MLILRTKQSCAKAAFVRGKPGHQTQLRLRGLFFATSFSQEPQSHYTKEQLEDELQSIGVQRN